MSNTETAGGGTSIIGLLGVAFVVLKLVGVIDWSWWWVLLPFYGGLLLFLAIIALGAVGVGVWAAIATLIDKGRAKKRAKARAKR